MFHISGRFSLHLLFITKLKVFTSSKGKTFCFYPQWVYYLRPIIGLTSKCEITGSIFGRHTDTTQLQGSCACNHFLCFLTQQGLEVKVHSQNNPWPYQTAVCYCRLAVLQLFLAAGCCPLTGSGYFWQNLFFQLDAFLK